MSRTGSSYARRWPISGGLRLWLALLVGGVLAATGLARANWATKDVQGTPNDVQVWGNSTFSVTTNQGAYFFSPDAGAPLAVPSIQAVGARLRSGGCFEVFLKSNGVTGANRCATGLVFGTSYDVTRVRTSQLGAAYALAKQTTQGLVGVAFTPTKSGSWATASPQLVGVPLALGVLRQGSTEHALFGVSGGQDEEDLYWYTDGVQQAVYPLSDTSSAPTDLQAINLFSPGIRSVRPVSPGRQAVPGAAAVPPRLPSPRWRSRWIRSPSAAWT